MLIDIDGLPIQSVNRSIWTTTPAVVNAYYSRNRNQISKKDSIFFTP